MLTMPLWIFHSAFPRSVSISLPGGVSVSTGDTEIEHPSVVLTLRDETALRAYV